MKLGKCPICKKDLNMYLSLDIDDFKRYDLDCKTKGCLIHELEWNYEDKEKLIKAYKKSMELSKISDVLPETSSKPLSKDQKKWVDEVGKSLSKNVTGPIISKCKPKQEIKVHYSKSGKLSGVKCSSGKFAKEWTKDIKKVNCYHCTFTAGYKLAKPKTV